MPEYLRLPPVASAIATFLGVALAITRLLTASKAFWWKFPEKVQKLLPALLVALGVLPTSLGSAKSWTDVAAALLFTLGTYFTASRGDQRPVELPVKAKRVPPLPLLVLCLALPLLLLSSCSSWKPVARTTNDVARVLCGEFFGQKQGISIEEAAKRFCETRDDLAPWLDAVLAAKREAAPKAMALHP